MQVVGIDLGTTNLRISTWDSDQPNSIPQPLTIGQGDAYTMPTVIAFRRQPWGEIETIVGEAADNLEDGPNQVVVRNLKRYALSDDPYVKKSLEIRDPDWWQQESWWWDQHSRSVTVFDQSFPAKDLISLILKESFQRAGLHPGFEWRAGCPVQAGFTYRSELAQVITELGGSGRGDVKQVIEEPLLLLALAHKLGRLDTGGSYLVYDLGGGSFDCALAQIEDAERMTIFGADGNPIIGGSDIDESLKDDLGYAGNLSLLRLAKERVSPAAAQPLPGVDNLSWEHYTAAVKKVGFIPKTFAAMRDSYVGSKFIWGRGENSPPVGEIIQRNPESGEVSFIWQLGWENLAEDVDKIILCGGPTKSPIFWENLTARFGDTHITRTSELIPPEIPDPELTAISAGACYAATGYIPVYVNRLPVRITLEDLQTGETVRYEPFDHFTDSPQRPFDIFVSKDALREHPNDPHSDARYELTVSTPDNALIPITGSDGISRERISVDPYINTRLVGSTLQLVVDRLGQVAVLQKSESSAPQHFVIVDTAPWQADVQAERVAQDVAQKLKADRDYWNEAPASRGRLVGHVVDTRTGVVVRGIYENE